jgi:hypothetical protein
MDSQTLLLAAGLMLAGLALGYYGWLRPWMYGWGARPDELTMTLRGGVLVAFSSPVTTRAITIAAPAEHGWDWLSQIGDGHRGSGYALRQDLCVGDTLWLLCGYGDPVVHQIAAVEANSYLALVSPADFRRLERGETASGCWEFYLRPDGCDTRLIVRRSGDLVGHGVFDVAQFVTERRMMHRIRDRAQRSWAAKQSSG